LHRYPEAENVKEAKQLEIAESLKNASLEEKAKALIMYCENYEIEPEEEFVKELETKGISVTRLQRWVKHDLIKFAKFNRRLWGVPDKLWSQAIKEI